MLVGSGRGWIGARAVVTLAMITTSAVSLLRASPVRADDGATLLRQSERHRIETIERASRSVVCILTADRSNGGSGVIVTSDGYGLTNFHVVMGMLENRRGLGGLSDGKVYPLEVLGIDPTGDLAMFRLTGRDTFDPAPLGDSDALRMGEPVIALGNPFMLAEDFTPTATFGIISGLNRYQYGADARSLVYTDCIQIDASINPGNSGGPLFDLEGRVIGINGRASFKKDDPLGALRNRVNVGVAYAISINQAKRFMPALKEGWLVEHGSLGATVADTPEGVRFDNLLPGSAAERIGIERGDELVSFDGRPIASANAFANAVGVYPAGWPVTVVYRRGNDEFRREVSLDALELRQKTEWTKADPAWIRAVAEGGKPTTLPFDAASLAGGPREMPSIADPLVASLMPHVVKIYGGRIGGQRGFASGVIVAPTGEIIAPLALLLEASDLRVVTSDGQVHAAGVKHRDAPRQLALLEIRGEKHGDAAGARPAYQGAVVDDSVRPAPGDEIYAIGNPFKIAEGSEPCSVDHGVVSGWMRLDARQPGAGRDVPYRGEVLVLDAMTSNTGSPGSAVFDLQGRLVGVVGEVVESRLTNTLLNYAYPSSEIAAFLHEAGNPASAPAGAGVSNSDAGPGYHGLKLTRLGYRQTLPFVESVARDSPAARAGVRAGDLIIGANGKPVPRAAAFTQIVEPLRAGEDLTLVVKRGEQLVTIEIKLEEAPK